MSGAAWTVPVIAVAATAPFAAASPSPCPVLSLDGWTRTSSGTLGPGNLSVNTAAFGRTGVLYNITEGQATGTQAITLTQNIGVRAGTTYTFAFAAAGNYGNNNAAVSASAYTELRVGDVTGNTLSTRVALYGNVQVPITPAANGWLDQTLTYTAASTGTLPVSFTWFLPPKGDQQSQDDIAVTVPSIACTQ
ncbi:hypothetical protein [Pseudoclavibacter terrae]|uniref:CBM-cenC domain-containing protein n=1 Tax=Pseudoclavibacter terrae TaxID=1530195 RepID=A0A7J5B6S1_9MICO|nr:hypothetical protein [Pseudoclavibacter terrae]KAB1639899.1 hypothetical protein F8O03_06220 [Pseudoclavibacter terrae]